MSVTFSVLHLQFFLKSITSQQNFIINIIFAQNNFIINITFAAFFYFIMSITFQKLIL